MYALFHSKNGTTTEITLTFQEPTEQRQNHETFTEE